METYPAGAQLARQRRLGVTALIRRFPTLRLRYDARLILAINRQRALDLA